MTRFVNICTVPTYGIAYVPTLRYCEGLGSSQPWPCEAAKNSNKSSKTVENRSFPLQLFFLLWDRFAGLDSARLRGTKRKQSLGMWTFVVFFRHVCHGAGLGPCPVPPCVGLPLGPGGHGGRRWGEGSSEGPAHGPASLIHIHIFISNSYLSRCSSFVPRPLLDICQVVGGNGQDAMPSHIMPCHGTPWHAMA